MLENLRSRVRKVKSQRAVECGEERGADGYLALELSFILINCMALDKFFNLSVAAFWFIKCG